ncbi:hypothetical protein KDL01_17765 [Actinospica durhamensis]|uniref:Uncharacterized protein n=1 Tax=Actinospica durhamensis TaxID=1508375 RepID=A0A941EPR5_9ACTN|nr:hypothetical protein [Actinospica durhamensis]MBR7835126.1 hypothetical protein [Actinospica durhamensis]
MARSEPSTSFTALVSTSHSTLAVRAARRATCDVEGEDARIAGEHLIDLVDQRGRADGPHVHHLHRQPPSSPWLDFVV